MNQFISEQTKKDRPLEINTLIPFSCLGCGNLCCGNLATSIHILPPEYIRIQWYLKRHPEVAKTITVTYPFLYDLEHSSGLPVMKLNFSDFIWKDQVIHACPFMASIQKGNELLSMCLIHPARPHTCRCFPLGMIMDGWHDNSPITTHYYLMSYCRGFYPVQSEGQIQNSDHLKSPIQTIQEWLDNEIDQEQYEEILYVFFKVITYYNDQGWHFPTKEPKGHGKLSEQTYNELCATFFSIPQIPNDPSQDHRVILAHLHFLRDHAEDIVHQAEQRASLTTFHT